MSDRYLRVILTIIAVELLWIGVRDVGTRVSAQATPAPMPVLITGVDIADPIRDPIRNVIPVYAPRAIPVIGAATLKVDVDRPIPVVGAAPLKIEADRPLKVETDRLPLKVESVAYTPGQKPGE